MAPGAQGVPLYSAFSLEPPSCVVRALESSAFFSSLSLPVYIQPQFPAPIAPPVSPQPLSGKRRGAVGLLAGRPGDKISRSEFITKLLPSMSRKLVGLGYGFLVAFSLHAVLAHISMSMSYQKACGRDIESFHSLPVVPMSPCSHVSPWSLRNRRPLRVADVSSTYAYIILDSFSGSERDRERKREKPAQMPSGKARQIQSSKAVPRARKTCRVSDGGAKRRPRSLCGAARVGPAFHRAKSSSVWYVCPRRDCST